MPEEFTPEEKAAMEEMAQDNEPVTEEEQAAAQTAPEPEPAPAEPEQKPEPATPAPEPDTTKPPEGFVPHQALHQERERRKAVEQRMAELEAMLQGKQQPAAEPDMPDPIMDPKGFAEWQRGQFDAQQKRFRDQEQAQIEQQQRQHRQQIAAQYEQQFMQQTPDYADAVKHLHQSRLAELRMYGLTDEQIGAQISQEANNLLDTAMQQGKNPAETLYQIAKGRGWAAPAAPAPAAQPDPATQLAAQAKAQANAGTLSTAGGPPANGGYTIEQLANMSEKELAKVPKDVLAKVMGA